MSFLPIPAPHPEVFFRTIRHPDLYLWDAWSLDLGNEVRLFCLAISRQFSDGTGLDPGCRNDFPFHVRQFKSLDLGHTWTDLGVFQTHNGSADGHDSRNIWSGSIIRLDGKNLVAYTGIRELGEQRPFLQSLAIAMADLERGVQPGSSRVLLCPRRDETLIRDAGYFLDHREMIGSAQGEQGGPILAWRDPFIFQGLDPSELYMVWAAKTAAATPAMGLARMGWNGRECGISQIYSPVELPDSYRFSQFEVPKVLPDPQIGGYLMVCASTSRTSESQPEHRVTKCIRMYRAKKLTGPWHPIVSASSRINQLDCLFGLTVLRFDAEKRKLLCVSPITEAAGPDLGLSFSGCFEIVLPKANQSDEVTINWIV